ncbi:MAG: hypothetical protein E7583_02855 [Ruminococcaceae bacterium]|nr:hypothetical protein [Oscillospiraceae bacterium]
MTLTIYADILFFINFLSDFIIIYLTGLFSDTGLRPLRAFISAVIGALCATALLSLSFGGIFASAFAVAFPMIMCFIAFGKRSHRAFWNIVFCFYMSAVLLYGGMYLMMTLYNMLFGLPGFTGRLILTLLFAALALIFYLLFRNLCQRSVKKEHGLVQAELCDGIRTYKLDLLTDSGNMVKDPFSARPVIIINPEHISAELLAAVTGNTAEGEHTGYAHIKPRVIPVKTVSGTTLLYAFLPQAMYIIQDGKRHKTDCIVAIDGNDNRFFGKDGIIPAALLEML